MPHYRYIIVGGGMTADAAISGIRRRDKTGSIAVFTEEPFPPYKRPPLSKGLWLDQRMEDIFLKRPIDDPGVRLYLSTRIEALDPGLKIVRDREGHEYQYDRLLLATGGRPRTVAGSPEGVIYFRTLKDYLAVYRQATPESRVIVVGGGFIGAEMAAVLSRRGARVTLVFPETMVLQSLFPEGLCRHLEEEYRAHHVELSAEAFVQRIEQDNGWTVSAKDGRQWHGDLVVAGLGLQPDTRLAADAGLTVDQGIVVNDRLATNRPDIYAAGDVAQFPVAAFGHHWRVEHEDNALSQGKLAGENMAGADKAYRHMPFFYSDLYRFGYEGIGKVDSRLTLVQDWVVPGEEGVIYYLDRQRVVGVVNWNVWDGIPKARDLINRQDLITDPEQLKGTIRNANA